MSLTLKNAITATQTSLDVLGTDSLFEGDIRQVDSEQLMIRAASPATLGYGEAAYQRLTVFRGVAGTTKATHAASASLSTPGGGGGGGVSVTDGTTTVAAATSINVEGATVAEGDPAEAVLSLAPAAMSHAGASFGSATNDTYAASDPNDPLAGPTLYYDTSGLTQGDQGSVFTAPVDGLYHAEAGARVEFSADPGPSKLTIHLDNDGADFNDRLVVGYAPVPGEFAIEGAHSAQVRLLTGEVISFWVEAETTNAVNIAIRQSANQHVAVRRLGPYPPDIS